MDFHGSSPQAPADLRPVANQRPSPQAPDALRDAGIQRPSPQAPDALRDAGIRHPSPQAPDDLWNGIQWHSALAPDDLRNAADQSFPDLRTPDGMPHGMTLEQMEAEARLSELRVEAPQVYERYFEAAAEIDQTLVCCFAALCVALTVHTGTAVAMCHSGCDPPCMGCNYPDFERCFHHGGAIV